MDDRCVIYSESESEPDELHAALTAAPSGALHWRGATALLADGPALNEPAVFVINEPMLGRLGDTRNIPEHAVVVAADDVSATALGARVDVALGAHDSAERARLLELACRLARTRFANEQLTREIARTDDEFDELNRIAIGLMHENDRPTLLQLIVSQGKLLTESDGAGLLLVDKDEHGVPILRGNVYDADSLPDLVLPEITFAIDDKTVVGHAATIGEPVVIGDVHMLPPGSSFMSSGDFQRRFNYPVRSLLVVPMIAQDKSLLGVLVFFNRKTEQQILITTQADVDRYVLPYTERQVRLARALASEAAVAIDNTRLQTQIQYILESLVKASVSAIDARDPTTAGHSLRVAAFTCNLAEAVEHSDLGRRRDIHFTNEEMRELYFAALMHDVGKVAVREHVLIKAKKLPPILWERVNARFELIGRTMELESARRRIELCDSGEHDPAILSSIDAELAQQLSGLERMRVLVRAANDPAIVEEPTTDARLAELAQRTFKCADGTTSHYLTDEELCFLQITKGSLDARERKEVESHVFHTAEFLARIPWTDDLSHLATYAGGHHEKLDGSGYPNHLRGDQIAIQTRMITLADMYDALTASDRPYKPAVPRERAIEIIRAEADAGQLDRDLVDVMVENLDTITSKGTSVPLRAHASDPLSA